MSNFSKAHISIKSTEFVIRQKLFSSSTDHLQPNDQVSGPWHKFCLRHLGDKFNILKFSKGHNSKEKMNRIRTKLNHFVYSSLLIS